MKKNNVKLSAIGSKRGLSNKARLLRKRAVEDAHTAWLWRKVQGGMQLKFDKYDEKLQKTVNTMSRRTFYKLVSLENRARKK
jgi:hypothetical protein